MRAGQHPRDVSAKRDGGHGDGIIGGSGQLEASNGAVWVR